MIRSIVSVSFSLVLSLLACTGCSILSKEPYVPTQYYDFGQPEPFPKMDVRLDIRAFTSSGPFRNRMIYRADSCRLIIDEYNRWIQPPNIILTRYLTEIFSNSITDDTGKDGKSVLIGGDIVGFDIDLKQKTARLVVLLQIAGGPSNDSIRERCVSVTEPFTRTAPDAFAAAMTAAAGKLALEIRGMIETSENSVEPITEKPVEPQESEPAKPEPVAAE
jgi:hypothetical protein